MSHILHHNGITIRDLHFRETQDPSSLEYAARQIQAAFGQQRYFQPDSLFVVTWDDVGYFNQKYDKASQSIIFKTKTKETIHLGFSENLF